MRLFTFLLLIIGIFLPFSGTSAFDRIVSLSPALTETVVYVGGGKKLVGVTKYCDIDICRSLPKVGGIVNPNLEAILSLKPNIVISTNMTPPRILNVLRKRGIKVVIFRLRNLKEIENAVEKLGNLLSGNGKEKREEFERTLKEETKGLSKCLRERRTLVLLSLSPPITAGRESYLGEMLSLAGAEVLTEGTFSVVSWEHLLSLRPEIVLVISDRNSSVLKKLSGKKFFLPKNDLLHPSPRLLKGAAEMRREICSE